MWTHTDKKILSKPLETETVCVFHVSEVYIQLFIQMDQEQTVGNIKSTALPL